MKDTLHTRIHVSNYPNTLEVDLTIVNSFEHFINNFPQPHFSVIRTYAIFSILTLYTSIILINSRQLVIHEVTKETFMYQPTIPGIFKHRPAKRDTYGPAR